MSNNKKSSFLSFPSIIFISIVGSSFVKVFLSISTFTAFALLLFVLSFISGRLDLKNHQKKPWRYIIYSLFFIAILFGLQLVFKQLVFVEKNESPLPIISEKIYHKKIFEKGDSIVLLSQDRQWQNNYGKSFQGNFSVREKDYASSKKEYAKTYQKFNQLPWGDLYQHLATSDTPRLDLILKKLKEIQSSKQLNQLEFADMIVTFIQDIPYSLVFEKACEAPEKYEKSIRDILERCPNCCIGKIPHGVQNPVGFMGNLKGDCDTRTVIIYAILSHFGYDVAILNSNFYRHSILGLHLPAKGSYKIHNGKRYYVWETTNKHFTLGTLPKNFNNIKHWYIMLTNT